MTFGLQGYAPLSDLGVIRVEGDDAVAFLQGQLTQDVMQLTDGQARLAAWCNAKGRMLASFIVVPLEPAVFALVLPRELMAGVLKRLAMFVLRAKARLSDASDAWQLWGVAGEPTPAPWSLTREQDVLRVALYPSGDTPRALWLAPAGHSEPDAPALAPAAWAWSEVHAGVATITAPIVEAFVPQMLNYESVGGVSFKKGCYPGQEVVARSQFRGPLKRRAFLARCGAPLAAGQPLFHESDVEQPCGLVAQAAPVPDAAEPLYEAIVSMQVAAAEGGALTLERADGPRLSLLPLPYFLLEDV